MSRDQTRTEAVRNLLLNYSPYPINLSGSSGIVLVEALAMEDVDWFSLLGKMDPQSAVNMSENMIELCDIEPGDFTLGKMVEAEKHLLYNGSIRMAMLTQKGEDLGESAAQVALESDIAFVLLMASIGYRFFDFPHRLRRLGYDGPIFQIGSEVAMRPMK